MLQCKRFHWEDEFNEWARKENIQGYQIVAVESSPPDSVMVFYDKNLSDKTPQVIHHHHYNYHNDEWTTTTATNTTTTNIKGV